MIPPSSQFCVKTNLRFVAILSTILWLLSYLTELLRRAGVYAQLYKEQTRKLRVAGEHIARIPGSLSPAPAGERTD